jgi:hypothetical protein
MSVTAVLQNLNRKFLQLAATAWINREHLHTDEGKGLQLASSWHVGLAAGCCLLPAAVQLLCRSLQAPALPQRSVAKLVM